MVAVQDEQAKLIEAIKNLAAVIARSEDVNAITRCINELNGLEARLVALEMIRLRETGSRILESVDGK